MKTARKTLTEHCMMASRNCFCLILFLATTSSSLVIAQSATPQTGSANPDIQNPSQLLHALDQLVEQNGQLEKQNRDLMDQITSMRRVLANQAGATEPTQKEAVPATDSGTGRDSKQ